MSETSEHLLNAENWKIEAEAVIHDIKDHVKEVSISKQLPSTDSHIYFNLTTLENKPFCILLSALGFGVVGRKFDEVAGECDEYFETPYSLLNKISPKFQMSFSSAVLHKLENVMGTERI